MTMAFFFFLSYRPAKSPPRAFSFRGFPHGGIPGQRLRRKTGYPRPHLYTR